MMQPQVACAILFVVSDERKSGNTTWSEQMVHLVLSRVILKSLCFFSVVKLSLSVEVVTVGGICQVFERILAANFAPTDLHRNP